MKRLIIAKIIVLILLNCKSVPVTESIVNQLIDEAKVTYKDDTRLMSTLNACSSAIADQNKTIIDLKEELERAKSKIESLNEELKEASRDAGFKDTFQFMIYSLLGLIVLALIGFVLYLILQGKLRIPFLAG